MVDVIAKGTNELHPTDILFQTPYWAQVKSQMGMAPMAFDIHSSETWVTYWCWIKTIAASLHLFPKGRNTPAEDMYGQYLEDLSLRWQTVLNPMWPLYATTCRGSLCMQTKCSNRAGVAFRSPPARDAHEHGHTVLEPEKSIYRHDCGELFWLSTLTASEDDILGNMKPKTRYNIGLAQRKGVTVHLANSESLADFYGLYVQTAKRNGFIPCSMAQFSAMFRCKFGCTDGTNIIFLLARHGRDILSGAIIGISGQCANFLYGAIRQHQRNYMASSLMHWTGMRMAATRLLKL